MGDGVEVRAHCTLYKFSSRGKQQVLLGSVSIWEGSQDLLSLCWPLSVGGPIYSLQFLLRGGHSDSEC